MYTYARKFNAYKILKTRTMCRKYFQRCEPYIYDLHIQYKFKRFLECLNKFIWIILFFYYSTLQKTKKNFFL